MHAAKLARFLKLAMAVALPAAAQCTTNWQVMAPGSNGYAAAMASTSNGDLIIGGSFTSLGSVAADAVARWDGSSWSPLGSGMTGTIFGGSNSVVTALLVLPDGDIIAAGDFASVGGVSTYSIARWDGTAWSGFGAGINGLVRSLAVLQNGDIVAAGLFPIAGSTLTNHIARWDGSDWHTLDTGVNTYFVNTLLAMPNGDLIAGGHFWIAGGVTVNKIARWDGVAWSALGTGMSAGGSTNEVLALAVLPNGDLIAGGNFTFAGGVAANRIARWDGVSWSALGSGVAAGSILQTNVQALSVLPNGDVLAAGLFTIAGGVAANYVARWDGVNWSPVNGGVDRAVGNLVALPNGDRIASGNFTLAGNVPVDGLARLTTNCAAVAHSYGAGCVGPSGPTVLASDELAWINGTFRAMATGMPTNGLAVAVFGFGQLALPMPVVHPLGVAGCELLVTDEILLQIMVASGQTETWIAIPGAAPLIGAQFYHQVVGIELDASSAITALTSTNALQLTIGAF